MKTRYEIKIDGFKITLVDNLTGRNYYGEWYLKNGKKYVKSRDAVSMALISKHWVNR